MDNLPMIEKSDVMTLTKEDIKKFFCPIATDLEIALFLKISQLFNLNPFKRELYLVKYGDSPAQILTGYEVYLKRAERTSKYGGFKVWTEGKIPELKACIEIYRKDWEKPLYHEVKYSEYVARTKAGEITKFWANKPETMLKKVVISQGMRFAFPDELAGMPYTQDEIIDITPENPKANVRMPKAKEPPKEITSAYSEMLDKFSKAKESIGEEKYYEILTKYNIVHANSIKSVKEGEEILEEMRKVVKDK